MFDYQFYGLTISSSVPLPVGDTKSNKSSTVSDIVFEVDINNILNSTYREFDDYVTINDDGRHIYTNFLTGNYEISSNRSYVTCKRFVYCDSLEDIAACFVGIVLPYILQLKGLIPLHASGVVAGEDVWGFMAGPGAGKSTIQTVLIKRGLKFFTDDVLPLSISNSVMAYPGYAALKIDKSSIIQSELSFDNITKLVDGATKYICSLSKDEIRSKRSNLKGLFVLKPYVEQDKGVCMVKLQGQEKLVSIMANTFTLGIVNASTMVSNMNKFSTDIFQNVTVYSMEYPRGLVHLNDVCDRILEVINYTKCGDGSVARVYR
ncbi:hypothetical protein NSQ26_08035 [Bacillus sp. FSL W7-1360]